MTEMIMFFSGLFFGILFIFLAFVFSVFVMSLVKKTANYEEFTPLVSVVIPAVNEEKNIGKCLMSIHNQDYPRGRVEVIVVDDGSIDRTKSVAQHFCAKVLSQNHKGKSEALNLGVQNAVHDIIFTIDADTVLEKSCLKNLVKPFVDFSVGATTGNSKVINSKTFLGTFQNIEYSYNNLIRSSFSKLFSTGIWFFGALACYRKDALNKVGGFKTDTLAEDMDIALDLNNAGYRTINVPNAVGYTVAPSTFKALYDQRARWWIGTLQALTKNKHLFFENSLSLKFLFINQFWWSFYSFISLPLIVYQVNYWLPSGGISEILEYLFRWFSLAGPVYVIYKIPEWGISIYNIFGVLSGLISAVMMFSAILMFKDKLTLNTLLGVFFYFPYTIFLNTIIIISMLKCHFWTKSYFIR
ncbi:glycosyltransferase family 2 protein [archaeon]|nr:glycosyltransferase family 2 protein [archaeon]